MPSKLEYKRGWIDAGFLPFEAHELVYGKKGVTVDASTVYNSAPGQRARGSRQMWILMLEERGWTPMEIRREIRAYYARDPGRNPFDFVKIEYRSPEKKDYQEAARRKAAAKIGELYLGKR